MDSMITRREMLRRAGLLTGSAALVALTPEWIWALQAKPQPDQLAQMRRHATERAGRFSTSAWLERLTHVYRDTLSTASVSRGVVEPT